MNFHKLNLRGIFSRKILAAAVGIILLAAAILKAYDIEMFMRQIRDYQIITDQLMVTLASWGLIIIEFGLGASLLVYYRPKITVSLSVALFCVFIGATLWAWVTGVTEDCGCFGSWVKRSPSGATIEDLFIVGALILSWPPNDYNQNSFSRIKLFIIIAALLAGIILPICFGAPIKELTGITQGDGTAGEDHFNVKGLEDIDLKNGSFIFVLIGTDCLHCINSVKDFNKIARKPDMPKIIALSADADEQIAYFIKELKPAFPIRKIALEDFYRLLGMGYTPRSILVVKRRVLRTWDEEVPNVEGIMEALGK